MTIEISTEDRLTPLQMENMKLFKGNVDDYPKALIEFCLVSNPNPIPEIKHETNKFSLSEMASIPSQVDFLRFLIRMGRYKNGLEIGTFMGSTTLAFAEELPQDGKITTIEKGEEFWEIAKKNFIDNPLGEKIESINGNALQVLDEFAMQERKFDFIYLDAAKQFYPDLYRLSSSILKPGGLLIIDDVFFHGDAINKNPQTDKGQGARNVVMEISKDPRFRVTVLPFSNGILLAYFSF